jgi:hypothetical protein
MDNLYGQRGCLCDLQQETRHLLVLILFLEESDWEGAATRPSVSALTSGFQRSWIVGEPPPPPPLPAALSPTLDLLVDNIVLHKGYLRSFYQLCEYSMYSTCNFLGN